MTKITIEELLKKPDLTGRINMLWHNGYWDGPLTGYVMLDNAAAYYVICKDDHYDVIYEEADDSCLGLDEDNEPCIDLREDGRCCMESYKRLYAVYKLSFFQNIIQLFLHAWFRLFVGTHTDYVANKRGIGSTRPRKLWALYYKVPKFGLRNALILNDTTQIVGWTTSLFAREGK